MMEAVPGRRLLLAILLLWAPSARAVEGSIGVDGRAGCPASDQVVAALEARLPGVTTPPRRLAPGGESIIEEESTWRLELERQGGEVVLRLRGARTGVNHLERRLAAEGKDSSPEVCAARAEAVAQVVVRYLREIGYRPPPPRPAIAEVPRFQEAPLHSLELPEVYGLSAGYLAVGAGLRAADPVRGDAAVSFQYHRTGWLAGWVGGLSAGATTESTAPVPGTPEAALRLRAFPLRLSLGLALELGRGSLVPMVGAGADLLSFRATGLADARSGLRVEPVGEAGLSYLWSGTRLFARGGVLGGLTFHAHDFDAGLTQPVFRTPSAYLRAQIELGVVLWKNRRRLRL